MTQLMIDCPQCNGDGFISFGDRHVENAKEVCSTCNGHGQIPARTGETPETSAPMAITDPMAGSMVGKLASRDVHEDYVRQAIEAPKINITDGMLPKDPVVEAVRADLLRRSQFGLRKYGTPLSRTDLDLRAWLNHAYEEALDFANYLKRSIMELGGEDVTAPTPVSPGVPDSVREKVSALCNSVLGNAYLGKEPEAGLAQEVKEAISTHPAGQSEQPILRAVVEVHPDRTDTRLTFGNRIRPEPSVKAVEQAIAALTAEYEARGGCPVVGRHPAGQSAGSGAEIETPLKPCPWEEPHLCWYPSCNCAKDREGGDDHEIDRILAMNGDELRTELVAEGHDPDALLRQMEQGLNGTLRLAADRDRWRTEAGSWRRVAERLEKEKRSAPDSTRTGDEGTEKLVAVPLVPTAEMLNAPLPVGSSITGARYESRRDLRPLIYAAMIAARPAAPEAQEAEIKVDVPVMRLSDGRADYYVRITYGGREVTPYKFADRYKAEYEAAHFAWVFGLRDDEPDLMAYNEASHPNEPAPPASSGRENA